MMLITCVVVVLRYVFNEGWIALQESVMYLHALLLLLGAAYTFKHNGHVRVDIFYTKMPDRKRALVDLLGTLFFLVPFCLFILATAWPYVASSWKVLEGSREAGGLPLVFLLKSLILVMPVLLLGQSFINATDAWKTLRNASASSQ